MEWTNYNHLFYFWTVARHGSVSKASDELHLSQPTISEQVRKLEESLGVKLFERAGRGIRLSEAGQVAFRHAEEIFRQGRALRAALSPGAPAVAARLVVGLAPSLSKQVACRLIAPALRGRTAPRLLCVEDSPEQLFARLALHQLDVILSDEPLPSGAHFKAFNHRIGSSGISFMAQKGSGKQRRGRKFPQHLDGEPFLMPEPNTDLHNSLQNWFDSNRIRPSIVGEFSDSALLNIFGQQGIGVFAVPTIVERDVRAQYKVEVLGRTSEIKSEIYAITADRRITHPAVIAISKAARRAYAGTPESK
jgi:LysR family transcriptional activator of nhaA